MRRIWQKWPERSERRDSLSKRYRKATWLYPPLSEMLAIPFIAPLNLLAENILLTKISLILALDRSKLNEESFSDPQLRPHRVQLSPDFSISTIPMR